MSPGVSESESRSAEDERLQLPPPALIDVSGDIIGSGGVKGLDATALDDITELLNTDTIGMLCIKNDYLYIKKKNSLF